MCHYETNENYYILFRHPEPNMPSMAGFSEYTTIHISLSGHALNMQLLMADFMEFNSLGNT